VTDEVLVEGRARERADEALPLARVEVVEMLRMAEEAFERLEVVDRRGVVETALVLEHVERVSE